MSTGIVRNDRGAIMLIGLFMAVVLVGCIYYLAGIAQTMVVRERMQDAADTGAYTQAGMHARGMNFIALSNVAMAAHASIWTTVRTVRELAGIGLDEARDECEEPDSRNCCRSIGPLETIRGDAAHSLELTAREAQRAIEHLDDANKAIAVAIPGAATGRFMDRVEGAYAPEAGVSFTWPAYNRLPVEVAPIAELGRTAGDEAEKLVDRPFDRSSLCSDADDAIDDARGDEVNDAAKRVAGRVRGRAQVPRGNTGAPAGWPAPRRGRMQVERDAKMGGEAFQVRALVAGERPGIETQDRGVEAMALLFASEGPRRTYERIRAHGRLTFAQGEFYFRGNADREQWLLTMNWESRLRRFRPPDGGSSPQNACRQWGGGGQCGNLNRIMGELGDLAIH